MRQILLGLISAWERMWCLLLFRRKHVRCDKSVRFHGIPAIYGRGTIHIGKNVRINSKTSANPAMGCYPKTVFNVTTGTLEIGDDVGMSSVAISCVSWVTIGNRVLLGGGVKIMDSDAHSLEYWNRGKGAGIDVPVSRPVTIGDRAIIGADAVVTKNVPPGEIWAGNPARKIGKAPEKGESL